MRRKYFLESDLLEIKSMSAFISIWRHGIFTIKEWFRLNRNKRQQILFEFHWGWVPKVVTVLGTISYGCIILFWLIISSNDISLNPWFSRKTKNGNIEAGTHLIIIDDSPCDQKSTEQLSNPKILNYYRQFLITGFDEHNSIS